MYNVFVVSYFMYIFLFYFILFLTLNRDIAAREKVLQIVGVCQQQNGLVDGTTAEHVDVSATQV